MENTILNIAVISFPRTASKFITNHYAKQSGKQPAYGVLHKSEYLHPLEKYHIDEIVYGHKHVLHGHWHTLRLLDSEILDYIAKEYRIVTTFRERKLVEQSIKNIAGLDYNIEKLIKQTEKERKNWNLYKQHIIKENSIIDVNYCPKDFL